MSGVTNGPVSPGRPRNPDINQAVLAQLQRVLKPTGTIALVEFRAEDPTVPVKELHKMSKAQILREYQANGFILVRSVDDLPWQHLMFFAVAAGAP